MLKGIYNGLDVGDINGDGCMDFVTANWVDGPEIYLQQSDGSWKKTPDAFPELMGGAIGVALGDLDLDGLRSMDYVTARDALTDIHGIGEKIGDCVLAFSLGKGAAFPVDRWVKRALVEWYGMPERMNNSAL